MADVTAPVPFGPLSLREDPAGLPDGALIRARNLRPAPTAQGAAREVVGTPGPIYPGLDGVVWGDVHERQRAADEASPAASRALRRFVAVERTSPEPAPAYRLAVYEWDRRDEPAAPAALFTYALPAVEPGDRLFGSLVPMGAAALVVVSLAAAADPLPRPLATLYLTDTEAVPYGAMPAGAVSMDAPAVLAAGEDGFVYGNYAFRTALVFEGGVFGPASPPGAFYLPPGNSGSPDFFPTYDKWYAIAFTVDDAGVSAFWKGKALGLGLFLSLAPFAAADVAKAGTDHAPTVPTDLTAAGGPYFLVHTHRWGDSPSVAGVQKTAGELVGLPALEEGSLMYCGISAVTGTAFNRRAVLGGAALDFPLPTLAPVYTGGAALDGRGRLAVEISTLNGTIRRYGPPVDVPTSAPYYAGVQNPSESYYGYPDRRARYLLAYHETTPGVWALVRRVPLTAPPAVNFAVLVDGAGWTTFPVANLPVGGEPTVTDAEVAAENARLDHDPNRLLATETNEPLRLLAARSQMVGDGPDDAVLAVRANAPAPSAGQYGDFPLVVICRSSPWLVRVGAGDQFFLGAAPLPRGSGAATPASVALVGGRVAAASTRDLRFYDPQPEGTPSSRDIECAETAGLFAAGLALGWHTSAYGDELWCASPDPDHVVVWALALSPEAPGWYEMDLDRAAFFRAGSDGGAPALYGVDGAGRLWREEALDDELDVLLGTAPLQLGHDGPKRLRRIRLVHRPALSTAAVAVVEAVPSLVPTERPDGELGVPDEPVPSPSFVSCLDGETTALYGGSTKRPRIIIAGAGRRGQRLVRADVEFEPRGAGRLHDGQRVRTA